MFNRLMKALGFRKPFIESKKIYIQQNTEFELEEEEIDWFIREIEITIKDLSSTGEYPCMTPADIAEDLEDSGVYSVMCQDDRDLLEDIAYCYVEHEIIAQKREKKIARKHKKNRMWKTTSGTLFSLLFWYKLENKRKRRNRYEQKSRFF